LSEPQPQETNLVLDQQPNDHHALRIWLYGHPVDHSLSPLIHNAAFRVQELHFEYLARDVPAELLTEAVADLRSSLVRGANITLPHKQAVMPLLDELAPEAERIGAVNTIVSEEGRLIGHNTDVAGFRKALRSVVSAGARGLSCLVLGAGGAARAVVAALLEDGAARIWIANRTMAHARLLCDAATRWGLAPCTPVPLAEVQDRVGEADLLVNATSVGISGSVKDLPLGVDTLHGGQVLVDIVYRNGLTPLVEMARSYEMWTGRQAPLDVMREKVENRAG
jgi:shikimate dehydrogenase